jgi:hypothetical protein
LREKWSSALLDVVISGGFQRYAEVAYEFLGFPVVIFNFEFRHVAHYPDDDIDDPVWDTLKKGGGICFPLIERINDNGIMRYVLQQKGAYVLKEGEYGEHPRIVGNIFSENDDSEEVVGFVDVFCHSPADVTKDRIDFVALFCRAISIEFRHHNMHKTNYINNATVHLMTRFFAGGEQKDAQYLSLLESFKKSLKANFAILAMQQPRAQEEHLTLLNLYRRVLTIIPEYNPVLFKSAIYVLCDNISSGKTFSAKCYKIFSALKTWKLKFGVSNLFSDIGELHIYQCQADYALKTAQTDEKLRYIFYNNCMLKRITEILHEQLSEHDYIHPGLQVLREHDAQNGTEYAKTLLTFIMTGQSYIKTLKKLHIHRNTLSYRLDIIKNMTEMDFDDMATCTQLSFYYHLSQTQTVSLPSTFLPDDEKSRDG